MGYYDVLDLLNKQLQYIIDEQDYLIKQRQLALQTKDIALELNINIRSVRNAIAKLLKQGEIQCIRGKIDVTERYYIINIDKVKTNGHINNSNNVMDDNGNNKPNHPKMDNKQVSINDDTTR